ncbi:MAG: ECF transporter S component [Acidimicrobiales bacterium]
MRARAGAGRAAVAGASVVGVWLFTWPFLMGGLPGPTAAAALALGTAAALLAVEASARHLDSRGLALLAALAALDAGSRAALVTGIGGFSPTFFLVLCGGYVFGPSYGFLLGSVSMLVSGLVTGGIGPWLPYQLFAMGWVGVAAGLAGRRRTGRPGWQDVGRLAAIGVVTGFAYGAAMDTWTWTLYRSSPGLGFHQGMGVGLALDHFGKFYLATSLGYDTFRAVGNAVLVLALGLPVLVALARLRARRTAISDGPAAASQAAGEPAPCRPEQAVPAGD